MLNEKDRRELDAIERELAAADPMLARRLRRRRLLRIPGGPAGRLAALGVLLAFGLIWLGLGGQALLLLLVLSAPFLVQRWLRRPLRGGRHDAPG